MGRVIVTCLQQLDRGIRITVADRLRPASLPDGVNFKQVDLRQHAALVGVLRGHCLVINSTSHHWNLPVMKAALAAGIHYMDLGGLFHFTRRQLKWDAAFRRKGLTAILGMGCAPGIANLLARWAADGMDRADSVHIKVGGKSWGAPDREIPYAIGTIREELLLRPAVFTGGRWSFLEPRTGVEHFDFPPPVGKQKIFWTLHSEVATLPRSLPGVREASFRIGFADETIEAVLHPRRKSESAAKPFVRGKFRDCEITMAVVTGWVDKRRIERRAWCVARSAEGLSAGDWDTAWPPAIVAHMVATGKISSRGVFPPEMIVPLTPFFVALKKVGFALRRT